MRLVLSSEAFPTGTPADLARACRRRALAGLEVAASEVQGVVALYDPEVPVSWLRLGETRVAPEAVEAAHRLGAGLLLPAPVAHPPAGIAFAIVHGSDAAEVARAVAWAEETGAWTAWQIESETLTPERVAAVLDQTRPTLAHVRLLGAGPEATDDEATADLMIRLALSGYAGTVALAPSADADLDAWARWLFKTRSWGCGSAHEKRARAHATPNA